MEEQSKTYIPVSHLINPNRNKDGINPDSNDYFQTLATKIKGLSNNNSKLSLIEDFQYTLINNPNYESLIRKTSKKIENLILKMMVFTSQNKFLEDKSLPNILTNFKSLVEFVDDNLEKVSDNIDILKGIRKDDKNKEIVEEITFLRKNFENIPQYKFNFQDIYCNNSYHHFLPKLKVKHNKMTEISQIIVSQQNERETYPKKFENITWEERKNAYDDKRIVENPYKTEIETNFNYYLDFNEKVSQSIRNYLTQDEENKKTCFSDDFTVSMDKFSGPEEFENSNYFFNLLSKRTSQSQRLNLNNEEINSLLSPAVFKYKTLSCTPFLFVDDEANFKIMFSDLKSSKEIAIDLEHHHKQSYLGLVCLMQISTRFNDYVVDTLAIRNLIPQLNEVFSDPNILKVLHGSDFDVMWLQRDFSIYINNLFDTGQASKVLDYTSFSLAYLMNRFCDLHPDKSHQLDDWRIRPLTPEMLKYAREDTHYLLYIYDNLKRELLHKAFNNGRPIMSYYSTVLKNSCEISLKKYYKPEVKDFKYYNLITRNALSLSKIQMKVFKVVYKYRDFVGRILDCFPDEVFPNNKIFSIARCNNITIEELYRICDRSPMRNYARELLGLIENKINKKQEIISNDDASKKYLEDVKLKMEKNANRILLNQKNKSQNENLIHKIKEFSELNNKTDIKNNGEIEKLKLDISVNIKKTNSKSNFYQSLILTKNSISSDSLVKKSDCDEKYNEVIDKIKEFNLVGFLKDKFKLKNIVITKNQKSNIATNNDNKIVSTEKPNKHGKEQNKSSTVSEKYLGLKREVDIDLTAIKSKEPNHTNESLSGDDEKDEFVEFESARNLVATSKFLTNILQGQDEIKGFKAYNNRKTNHNINVINSNSQIKKK